MAIQALLVILAVLLVLLFLGVPISYAIAVSSLTAILSSIDLNVAVLTAAQRTFVGMSKFSLTAIPFFILAGNIMNQGGIAKRLVDFVMAILGKMPGALLVTNIGTNALFGAISGSASAAAAAAAFCLATLYHYFLGNILVFTSGARYEKGKELSLVFAVSIMGLAFNLILMYIFVGMMLLQPMFAKVLASCIVVIWNYLARKKWIF